MSLRLRLKTFKLHKGRKSSGSGFLQKIFKKIKSKTRLKFWILFFEKTFTASYTRKPINLIEKFREEFFDLMKQTTAVSGFAAFTLRVPFSVFIVANRRVRIFNRRIARFTRKR